MLDIIFSNRVYDLGEYFNFGNIFDAINTVSQNESKGMASEYEKKKSAFAKALTKWVEEIEGLE
jgi:abortive infection bacteriophage resistance protein